MCFRCPAHLCSRGSKFIDALTVSSRCLGCTTKHVIYDVNLMLDRSCHTASPVVATRGLRFFLLPSVSSSLLVTVAKSMAVGSCRSAKQGPIQVIYRSKIGRVWFLYCNCAMQLARFLLFFVGRDSFLFV
jgi:hypothetical protein